MQRRFGARQRWRFDWSIVTWHNGRCDRRRYRNRERIIGRKNDLPGVWIEYDADVLLDRMRGRGERYQYDGCVDRSHLLLLPSLRSRPAFRPRVSKATLLLPHLTLHVFLEIEDHFDHPPPGIFEG